MTDKTFDPVTDGTPEELWDACVTAMVAEDDAHLRLIQARDNAMRRKGMLEAAEGVPTQDGPRMPRPLAFAVYTALYVPLYGTCQSFDRLLERGGFSWNEVALFYGDALKKRTRKQIESDWQDAIRTAAEKISDPLQVEERCNGKEES